MFLQVQFLDQTVCNKLLACHNCVFQQDFWCIVVANLICATVYAEFNRPKLRGNLVLSVIVPLVDQDVAYTLLSLFSPHISFISSLFFSQPLPGWSFSVFATVGVFAGHIPSLQKDKCGAYLLILILSQNIFCSFAISLFLARGLR